MWFENMMGFSEKNPENVRNNCYVKGERLVSRLNNKEYVFGNLNVPSLNELRQESSLFQKYKSTISISEEVGGVQLFHCDKKNNGAFFQAASQFNLLEMTSPRVNPEEGVGIYEYDLTQGPACAIACGAGTIYRNYFANVNGEIGQSSNNQIDCLSDIGEELGNKNNSLWNMINGYALANEKGLNKISKIIKSISAVEYEELKGRLRIGLQSETEVTINESGNIVTQAYCSALPIAYSNVEKGVWESFARLILEATYEATFYSALLNYERTQNRKVHLTLVGGGVFGNEKEWIFDAIKKSLIKFSKTPLDIKIISYGNSNPNVQNFLATL